jgi:hypothetical protein
MVYTGIVGVAPPNLFSEIEVFTSGVNEGNVMF